MFTFQKKPLITRQLNNPQTLKPHQNKPEKTTTESVVAEEEDERVISSNI